MSDAMKASKLIKELAEQIEAHGDLECVIKNYYYDELEYESVDEVSVEQGLSLRNIHDMKEILIS